MINLDDLHGSKPKKESSIFDSKLKQFKFQIPNVLHQKVNATDKSSPLTLIKFSGKSLISFFFTI